MAEIKYDHLIRKNAKDEFLEFVKACPEAVSTRGFEKFEKELEKAVDEYTKHYYSTVTV